MVCIGVQGFLSLSSENDIEKVVAGFLSRALLSLPLIWLALFSSKQYRQNKVLKEAYAHKEVLAMTYQGYKKEFGQGGNQDVIDNLNNALVASIAQNPSTILDDGSKDDSPSIWGKVLPSIFSVKKDENTDKKSE